MYYLINYILQFNANLSFSVLTLRRKIDTFTSKEEFSGSQGKVLHFLLAQTDDVFQKDIEEEYGLRPSTATELLKKMEKNGLIYRQPTSYDGRLKKIIVSEKGLKYKEQVICDLSGLEDQLTKGISPKDLDVFFNVLEKMLENLSE